MPVHRLATIEGLLYKMYRCEPGVGKGKDRPQQQRQILSYLCAWREFAVFNHKDFKLIGDTRLNTVTDTW